MQCRKRNLRKLSRMYGFRRNFCESIQSKPTYTNIRSETDENIKTIKFFSHRKSEIFAKRQKLSSCGTECFKITLYLVAFRL